MVIKLSVLTILKTLLAQVQVYLSKPHFLILHYKIVLYIQSCANLLLLNSIPITIAGIYCPPKHIIFSKNITEFLSTLNHNYILGGDIKTKHIKWGYRASNPRELFLSNATVIVSIVTGLLLIVNGPIFLIFLSLDFLVISKHKYLIFFGLCSDHSPVMLSVDCVPPTKLNTSTL